MTTTEQRSKQLSGPATAADVDDLLQGRRLVLASNRGPLEYYWDEDGALQARRGSGGVVTALSALGHHAKLSWVASALTEADRLVGMGCLDGSVPGQGECLNARVRFVVSPAEEYDLFYNVFANPVLWFVQHNLHHLLPYSGLTSLVALAWHKGYRPVNRAFADAVLAELRRDDVAPVVMLHDYQFYLAAGFIRDRAPSVILQQFIHIPWPEPSSWRTLPSVIVRGICRGLLANDIIGFQTNRDAANFLTTCEAYLPEVRLDGETGEVFCAGRTTAVRSYPISVHVGALRQLAESEAVLRHERRLRALCGERTIVRVDRLDPSKNLLTGFQAFAKLLERRPDLREKVRFLSFLVPSRTGIAEYQRYARQVFELIETINGAYGRDGWRPIEVFYENNYHQAIAGMRLYDVLMVNSGLDGMNLVSKEGPIVNTRDGALVLSRGAGSYEQLAEGALGVRPYDVGDTSRALEYALEMPTFERRLRARVLRNAVERNDIADWLQAQLADLRAVAGSGRDETEREAAARSA
ncbi:MAG: trehalose-6-phosphate synthase [Chloroflexi bacterium]|nr:trehalose-6-phosphate synthase [Chloroflexota bacterium]